jgi:hypothetical protein
MLVSAFVAAITCDGSVVMLKLGTIEQEAAACLARWQGFDVGTFAAHVHHDAPFEMLYCTAEVRIAYILSQKPEDERALRLRCFAPVDLTGFPKLRKSVDIWNRTVAAWRKARAESEEASTLWRKTEAEIVLREICAAISHKELCPLGENCPWDGETIFPEAE